MVAGARQRDMTISALEVQANEISGRWIVCADVSGERHCRSFPFASKRGIYTPAELAELFLEGTWPFGPS